eukprot:1177126-Prorocentrum_minimum.AAC.2
MCRCTAERWRRRRRSSRTSKPPMCSPARWQVGVYAAVKPLTSRATTEKFSSPPQFFCRRPSGPFLKKSKLPERSPDVRRSTMAVSQIGWDSQIRNDVGAIYVRSALRLPIGARVLPKGIYQSGPFSLPPLPRCSQRW